MVSSTQALQRPGKKHKKGYSPSTLLPVLQTKENKTLCKRRYVRVPVIGGQFVQFAFVLSKLFVYVRAFLVILFLQIFGAFFSKERQQRSWHQTSPIAGNIET